MHAQIKTIFFFFFTKDDQVYTGLNFFFFCGVCVILNDRSDGCQDIYSYLPSINIETRHVFIDYYSRRLYLSLKPLAGTVKPLLPDANKPS